MQHAVGGNREVLDYLAIRWQLTQLADGVLLVLRTDGIGDIVRGQFVESQLRRIQPDAHGVVGVTAHRGHAGPRNPLHFIEHNDVGKGAELCQVVLVFRILDGHHHHDRLALLLDIHALVAYRLRQLWQSRIDTVKHVGLSQSGVLVDVKENAQRHVPGRIGRVHVEHAIGTIDLKLNR